ncbi:MAG: outer membrane lipoprotein-sorting protein [Acidobacteriia bacterium]|nr:outer membrane lipoprotein-sorting protein [Terriglobia bacterium]
MHSSRLMTPGAKVLLGLLLCPGLVFSGLTLVAAGQAAPRPGERSKEKSGENDPARFEEAKKWIARSVSAYGGEERLAGITDLSFASESAGPQGHPVKFKVYYKGTDRFRSEVSGSDFFAMTIVNGPSAWLKSEQTLIELTASDTEPLKISTQLQSQPYDIFDRLTKFWAEGERSIEGVRYLVIGTSGFLGKNFARGEISLDSQTFLVRRFEYEEEVETKQGRGVNKFDMRYEDYRAFGGIQFPTRVRSNQPGAASTITFSDFKVNPGVPDSFFEKPH